MLKNGLKKAFLIGMMVFTAGAGQAAEPVQMSGPVTIQRSNRMTLEQLAAASKTWVMYKVQPGDNLWIIAKKFCPADREIGLFIHDIIVTNHLPWNDVQVGDELAIHL